MAQVKSLTFRYIMTYYNRQRIYTANPGGLSPDMYRQAARGLPHKLQILGVHILQCSWLLHAKADTEIKRQAIQNAQIRIGPDLPDWTNDNALMTMLMNLCCKDLD